MNSFHGPNITKSMAIRLLSEHSIHPVDKKLIETVFIMNHLEKYLLLYGKLKTESAAKE